MARLCRKYLRLPVPIRADIDDWYDHNISLTLRAEVEAFRPHAVLMMYVWFSAALHVLPKGVLKVLDAQDVFTDRNERLRRAGIDQVWFSVPKNEEARGLDRFNVVLAIQRQEAEHYRSLTSCDVVTVGHLLPTFDSGTPNRSPELLLVGSANAINVDGVRWFLTDVWPSVRQLRPEAVLRIVGKVGEFFEQTDGVVIVGSVPDLAAAYRACRLVVSPLRGGTGLKIKTAEALAAGRVVISTPAAALGLEAADGHGMVIADTAATMIASIVRLLDDDQELDALSAEARAFAIAWNSAQDAALLSVFSRATPPSSEVEASNSRHSTNPGIGSPLH